MEWHSDLVLLVLYILPDVGLCELCQTSTGQTYDKCESCCGPAEREYCCPTTTTDAASPAAPDWWIVGVCASVSVVLVVIFTATLMICTKKKIQRRILQSRQLNVIQVGQFSAESSFTARPTPPPPYTRDAPHNRPPSYTSQRGRSARRSARYASNNQENSSRGIPPSDTYILPTGRPPEYTTSHTSQTEVAAAQHSVNVNTNRTTILRDVISPPPAYSAHSFL